MTDDCSCSDDPMVLAGNSLQIIDVVAHLLHSWLVDADIRAFEALTEFPPVALVMGVCAIIQGVGWGCQEEEDCDLAADDVMTFLLVYGKEHAAEQITEAVRGMIKQQCHEN